MIRWLLLLSLVTACGHHPDSGVTPDATVSPPDACVGDLECFVVNCSAMGLPSTTLTGTVYAPNGTLPLYGVDVYVPRTDPGPLTEGVTCAPCSSELPGGAIASTRTDEAGHFTLTDVPATSDVPVIVQVGKWRRQLRVPVVSACQTAALPVDATQLPKDRTQGDLPTIAISTGGADALECLIYRLGVAAEEFTTPAGGGRVQMYANFGVDPPATPPDNGRGTDQFSASWPKDAGQLFGDAQDLWATKQSLDRYDIVVLSCEGNQYEYTKPIEAFQAVHDYADGGGRLFMSHWHNIWIGGSRLDEELVLPEWQNIATWDFVDNDIDDATQLDVIDETVAKGASFASWMQNVGASTTRGELSVTEPRYTCVDRDATKAERWVYVDPARSTPTGRVSVQNFLFTTPQSKPADDRCGKVVFSDMHVSSGSLSQGGATLAFPLGCSTGDLTPQEKALAFMFFDIATCASPIL